MAIEEYLLVWYMPFAIIFYCIIGLCGIGIVSSKSNEIQGNLTKPTFLIALAIYGVVLGILIGYNVISSFKGNMPTDNLAVLLEDEIAAAAVVAVVGGGASLRPNIFSLAC